MIIAIAIAVKPRVKKYLMRLYGTDKIRFKKSYDPIHFQFLSLLDRPSITFRNPNYKKLDSKEKVEFLISEDMKERSGCVVSEENVLHFNFFIDYLIKKEFFLYVDSFIIRNTKDGERVRIKIAIDRFMEEYELTEDDIKFETLKKAYYRYKRKKQKKCSVKLSLKKVRMSLKKSA
jgi:hypothetical protein